jgi:alpha-beta hydrolase superfamily lysophospholipase
MKYLFSLMLLSLVSCAGMKNFDRPVPTADDKGTFVTVRDGTEIFVFDKQPAGQSRTTIYVLSGITGINHHAEKDVIEALSGTTIRVVVIHTRGTGYSEGARGDIANFSDFIDDYVEVISHDSVSEKSNQKVVLYGHSMSTAVALTVAEHLHRIDGIILVNPPYKTKSAEGMTPSIWDYMKYACYYLFAWHTPIVNMAGDPASIQDEEERKEAELRNQDPLLVKYFSLYSMMEVRKMMDRMVMCAERATYPLLLIYGTADSIVEKSGCDEIFSAWGSKNKRFEIVENGPHGKPTVLKSIGTIQSWIADL